MVKISYNISITNGGVIMKVLAISSSPRRGGNSDVLCDEFLKGAAEAGHETRKIRLAEKKIAPCAACYGCTESHVCVRKDDMAEVLKSSLHCVTSWRCCSTVLKRMIRLLISGNCKHFSKTFSPYLTAADDGISGTNTKKREEFNHMIDDCKAGNIDMVITKSISRFAKNTLDCLKYIRQLKDMNIPVLFEKESINTMDAKGEVLITIMASLAQQESQSLSQNVKLGLQYRYQQGKVQINHNRFLGYTKDADGNLIIDPKQSEIVKRIYREYLE